MFIKREINNFFAERMFCGKVLVVYGPRQSGKTTAIERYLSDAGLAGNAHVLLEDGPRAGGRPPGRIRRSPESIRSEVESEEGAEFDSQDVP